MNSRAQTILDYAIVSMIAGMILSTVSSQKIPSFLFYVLIAASCLNWYIHCKKGTSTEGIELKQHKTLFILCSVSLLAVLVSKVVHLNMSGTEIEKAVRFSVGLPLLYAGLRFIPYGRLKHALWGVYAAIIFQLGYAVYHLGPSLSRPDTSAIHNAVSYGVIVILLSFVAILSIKLKLTNLNKTELLFKFVSGAIGFATLMLLQTRTGILVIPILSFLLIVVFFKGMSLFKILSIYIVFISAVFIIVSSNSIILNRINGAIIQFEQCIDNNLNVDSSICTRLQLINASIEVWKEQPIFGTSDNSAFQKIMKDELVDAKVVTKITADNFGEPHNDYVQYLSSFGVLGLLGLFLMYLSPASYFIKKIFREESIVKRCMAGMGAAVCLSFMIFSSTELMFRNMRTISFYTVLLGFFLVFLNSTYSIAKTESANNLCDNDRKS